MLGTDFWPNPKTAISLISGNMSRRFLNACAGTSVHTSSLGPVHGPASAAIVRKAALTRFNKVTNPVEPSKTKWIDSDGVAISPTINGGTDDVLARNDMKNILVRQCRRHCTTKAGNDTLPVLKKPSPEIRPW